MRPPPPGWFSTMTGRPRIACMRRVTSRATASVEPPGGTGTMSLTVRSGKVWAGAWTARQAARTAAVAARPHRMSPNMLRVMGTIRLVYRRKKKAGFYSGHFDFLFLVLDDLFDKVLEL